MPGQVIAVPGTNSRYAMFQASLAEPETSALWRCWYMYQGRGVTTREQRWSYVRCQWPSRGRMGFYSDPAVPAALVFGLDESSDSPGDWEPFHYGFGGSQSTKFIVGECRDSLGAVVSGAVVQGFLTATDGFVAETTSDANGRYELGTPNPGAQHYIVAYRAGSPDIAGTTVNTLVPTNRDGS